MMISKPAFETMKLNSVFVAGLTGLASVPFRRRDACYRRGAASPTLALDRDDALPRSAASTGPEAILYLWKHEGLRPAQGSHPGGPRAARLRPANTWNCGEANLAGSGPARR